MASPFWLAKLFIGLALLASLGRYAQANSLGTAENFYDLKKLSENLPENLKPTDTKSMAQFCQVNGYRDRLESFYSVSGDLGFADFGWENSFYATFQTREHAFLLRFSGQSNADLDFKMNSETFKIKAWDKLFKRLTQNTDDRATDGLAAMADKLNSDEIPADQAADLEVGIAAETFVCTDLTLKDLPGCATGLNLIQKIAKPVSSITMLPLWVEIAKDPTYLKVFRKISAQIAKNIFSRAVPRTRFFDDLNDAFFSETHKSAASLDYAWKTMALLSSGGGNTFYRAQMISLKDMPELSDLLWIMTMGSLTLDQLTLPKGFLYSYPKEITTACDYGKTYHFWMTAYLAREVFKLTQNVMGSAAAAYSAEKGYQFAKKEGARDPSKPFTQNAFSNYNDNIRLDLSLAAAGAWYGAQSFGAENSLTQEKMNLGIVTTFKGAEPIPLRANFTAEDFDLSNIKQAKALYSEWKKLINSDAPFKYFQKESSK